jgi:D-alanyl-D-alanine dipeptidase
MVAARLLAAFASAAVAAALATPRAAAQQPRAAAAGLPAGFVFLADVDPTIRQDMRYSGADNFVGRRIAGYEAPECILTREAADALARVQAQLQPTHALKVFDCYRPQRAVNDMVAWINDERSTNPGRKADHFPTVDRTELIRRGFVSATSAHSRGSTVDLAIVALVEAPEPSQRTSRRPCRQLPADIEAGDWELDFGTSFDCFHAQSATASTAIGEVARANRDRLVGLMQAAGFRNYAREWWHFTLEREPFQRAFDFPVRARPTR